MPSLPVTLTREKLESQFGNAKLCEATYLDICARLLDVRAYVRMHRRSSPEARQSIRYLQDLLKLPGLRQFVPADVNIGRLVWPEGVPLNQHLFEHIEKGGEYHRLGTIIGSGNLNGQSIMVYMSREDGKTYGRLVSEWSDKMQEADKVIGSVNDYSIHPHVAKLLERSDWTATDALKFYADGYNFDTVHGRSRILDNGEIAAAGLKQLDPHNVMVRVLDAQINKPSSLITGTSNWAHYIASTVLEDSTPVEPPDDSAMSNAEREYSLSLIRDLLSQIGQPRCLENEDLRERAAAYLQQQTVPEPTPAVNRLGDGVCTCTAEDKVTGTLCKRCQVQFVAEQNFRVCLDELFTAGHARDTDAGRAVMVNALALFRNRQLSDGMPDKEWVEAELWNIYGYGPRELRSTAEKTIQSILTSLGYI